MRNEVVHKYFYEPYEKEYKGIPLVKYSKIYNAVESLVNKIERRIFKRVGWKDV